MRKVIFGLVAAFCVAFTLNSVHAQALPLPAASDVSPQGWTADQWVEVVENVENGMNMVGKPMVYMLNPSKHPMVLVKCQRYVLVGPNAYNKNPLSLPAWKSTVVNTTDFDGYCTDGVKAQDDVGNAYTGLYVGTFSDATFIVLRRTR